MSKATRKKHDAQIQAEALRLHRAGVSFAKIGRTLGINGGSVWSVVEIARRAERSDLSEAWLLAVSKPWRAAA